MWCVPILDDEFIQRMEEILDLYKLPYNRREPVVCLDEKPVQLLTSKRKGIAMGPGYLAVQDYEYVRRGTANIFCGVEPLAGRHFIKATPNRKGPAFADMLREIAQQYPRVDIIHLVVDNLNTHGAKSLITRFGPRRGMKLWRRFHVHYTPKHASWLNQAEIEISLLSRQCLGDIRIANLRCLRSRTMAWASRANRQGIRICWGFTKSRARKKWSYQQRSQRNRSSNPRVRLRSG
ncbi:MAG: IS630 family transposase [Planctomycetota bacterium]|jgi:hypothetical protein